VSASYFIAKRYIAGQRRNGFLSFITTFAILGVTLGTAALIITVCILDGFEREIKLKVIGFTSHIQVQGFHGQPLFDYEKSIAKVQKQVQGIKGISPFVAKEGMIRFRDAVDGIFLKGVDINRDVSMTKHYIISGSFLNNSKNGIAQIAIGKKLADRLNVNLGDKVVVFGLPIGESQSLRPRVKQFQVVGLYESGMSEYDDIYAYTSLENAQNIFQTGDAITGLEVIVDDINTVDEKASAIQETLGYPHYARTVFQQYRNLFSWVELQKELSPVLLALIIIVATVNIIGTLLMFVLEKTKAIGILKSLGAGRREIQNIFILQGLVIASIGIIIGNIIAYLLCWLQLQFHLMSLPSDIYYMSSVPINIRVESFAIITVIAFVLCLLTTILPARAAAKLDTISALRFG
jgi:lipoprotein-releasing system permease protein